MTTEIRQPAERGATPGHRVLVVDDDPSIRTVLSMLLRERGCETRQAGTAQEALDLISASPPTVALLDVVLPGPNGLDLLRVIKTSTPDVQVVMMTGHDSAEVETAAIRMGAFDYVTKPFLSLEAVWIMIQRALERAGDVDLDDETTA